MRFTSIFLRHQGCLLTEDLLPQTASLHISFGSCRCLCRDHCHKRHRLALNFLILVPNIVTTRIFKPVHLYKFLIFVFLRIFFYFKQKRCRSVSQIKTEHFACRNRCRSKIENQTEYAYISDHISPWRSTSVFPFFF